MPNSKTIGAAVAVVTGLLALTLLGGTYAVLVGAFTPYGHAEVPVQAIQELPHGSLIGNVAVDVPTKDASLAKRLVAVGRELPSFIVALLSILLLLQVLRATRRGEIFINANVRRLRVLGLVLLAAAPVATFVRDLANRTLLMLSGGPGQSIAWRNFWRPGDILAAVLLFGLAQVFAQGVALREDAEGTV